MLHVMSKTSRSFVSAPLNGIATASSPPIHFRESWKVFFLSIDKGDGQLTANAWKVGPTFVSVLTVCPAVTTVVFLSEVKVNVPD